MRSIRHNLSLVNPCWLLQITFLSFVCRERISRSIYFTTSLGTEVMHIGLNFNFPLSVSSSMGCISPTNLLPASTISCVPPSHSPAQSEAPCILLLACCHACPTSCTWEWNVLMLWWSRLEDQPALLGTSTLQGSFQREDEEAKICPSEVQACNSVVNLDHSSQDLKLYNHLVAADNAAVVLYILIIFHFNPWNQSLHWYLTVWKILACYLVYLVSKTKADFT